MGRARRRGTVLIIYDQGLPLMDPHGDLSRASKRARAVLAAGPPPLTPAEWERGRYGLTCFMDDLVDTPSTNRYEQLCFADFTLREASHLLTAYHGAWTGIGKWLPRRLLSADPASETDVLAALLVLGTLRDKLLDDELMLITLARTYGVTWTRIADALEMKSRQSAERRHLQLSRSTRADGTRPRTQNERVEHTRERRRRRAERDWALANAGLIRTAALAMIAFPDLQERANRSREGVLMSAPVSQDGISRGPVDLTWPSALKESLAEHLRFRADPRAHLSPDRLAPGDEEWQLHQRQADIIHRMLGLLRYAADPRHLNLSDHPDLRELVAHLDQAPAIRTRR